jgi:hypothetical protein
VSNDRPRGFREKLVDVAVGTATVAAVAGVPVLIAYDLSDGNLARVIKNEFVDARSDLGGDNVRTIIDAYVETRRQTTTEEIAKHYNKEPKALTEQDAVNFAIGRTLDKIHNSELPLSAPADDKTVTDLLTDFSVQFLVRKAEQQRQLARMHY